MGAVRPVVPFKNAKATAAIAETADKGRASGIEPPE